MKCDARTIEALALGGAVLGGGGGGSLLKGFEVGQTALALGEPVICTLGELDTEATVISVSAVGAPAAEEQHVRAADYIAAVEMLAKVLPDPVQGLITNEMGGMASVNGLVQSAVLGIPVVDAPWNGRAHPVSTMGAMGLDRVPGYTTWQAACGGDPLRGRHMQVLVHGNVQRCGKLVRETSIQAGGLVAVARNPVAARYLRDNAAVGAMEQAISLGLTMLDARNTGTAAEEAARFLGGELVVRGRVTKVDLETKEGFDVGSVWVDGTHELVFWNEYMLLETGGRRTHTFPDLIATLDRTQGLPVSSAEIREGMEVVVLAAGREKLLLGSGMREPELLRQAEQATGRSLLHYMFEEE